MFWVAYELANTFYGTQVLRLGATCKQFPDSMLHSHCTALSLESLTWQEVPNQAFHVLLQVSAIRHLTPQPRRPSTPGTSELKLQRLDMHNPLVSQPRRPPDPYASQLELKCLDTHTVLWCHSPGARPPQAHQSSSCSVWTCAALEPAERALLLEAALCTLPAPLGDWLARLLPGPSPCAGSASPAAASAIATSPSSSSAASAATSCHSTPSTVSELYPEHHAPPGQHRRTRQDCTPRMIAPNFFLPFWRQAGARGSLVTHPEVFETRNFETLSHHATAVGPGRLKSHMLAHLEHRLVGLLQLAQPDLPLYCVQVSGAVIIPLRTAPPAPALLLLLLRRPLRQQAAPGGVRAPRRARLFRALLCGRLLRSFLRRIHPLALACVPLIDFWHTPASLKRSDAAPVRLHFASQSHSIS